MSQEEYGQERSAIERAEYGSEEDEFMSIEELSKLYSILIPRHQGEFDGYFPVILKVVNRKLFDAGVSPYMVDDVYEVMGYTSLLNNKENINPVAFLLGYILTESGRSSINQEGVNKLFKKFDKMPFTNIGKVDIIRYCRWWMFNVGNFEMKYVTI
jgi:hypothetical protein